MWPFEVFMGFGGPQAHGDRPGGPPHSARRYPLTQLRGAEPKLTGQSVYITGYTPFDHTVRFEWA